MWKDLLKELEPRLLHPEKKNKELLPKNILMLVCLCKPTIEVVKSLLTVTEMCDAGYCTAIHYACQESVSLEVIDTQVTSKNQNIRKNALTERNDVGDNALHVACKYYTSDELPGVITLFIKHGGRCLFSNKLEENKLEERKLEEMKVEAKKLEAKKLKEKNPKEKESEEKKPKECLFSHLKCTTLLWSVSY